jgi:replicative DNA helicase
MPVQANGHSTTAPPSPAAAPQLTRLSDLLVEWQTFAEQTHEAYTTGQPRGPVTGFTRLDAEIGGAIEPGLHILHGQPGAGKTAFALQLAATCGFPALIVSCEMAPLELLRRITARTTETFLGRLRTGELAPVASLALVKRAVASAPLLALADGTLAYPNLEWMKDAALAVKGSAEHVLIVVDSVHSWAESAPGGIPEYEGLNAALAGLRTLAGALSCPVLAVAERNRASMGKGGLSAGAGTRKIEYGATTVLDLQRDLDKPADAMGEVDVTLALAKNRNGAAGRKVNLKFHGAIQRFRDA